MLGKVDISMFSTFEKIKELAKKQGKSLGQVEEDLNYGRNTLYKIKNSTPNAERLGEIANYFNVSTDYLLGRTDNPKIAQDGHTSVAIDLKKRCRRNFLLRRTRTQRRGYRPYHIYIGNAHQK